MDSRSNLKRQILICILSSLVLPGTLMLESSSGKILLMLYILELLLPFVVFIFVLRDKGVGSGFRGRRIFSAIFLWCVYIVSIVLFMTSDIFSFLYFFFEINYPYIFRFSIKYNIGIILLQLSHAIGIALVVILSYKWAIHYNENTDE